MLRIHQHQKAGIGVVRPQGRMNFHNAHCLPAAIDALLARGVHNVVVSLGGLASGDGSAISASLFSLDRVRASGGDIAIVDPARSIGDLVTLTSLCVHFTICGTEAEAIAGFLSDQRPQDAGASAPWSAVAATA